MSHVREAHDVEVELVVGDACGHDVMMLMILMLMRAGPCDDDDVMMM